MKHIIDEEIALHYTSIVESKNKKNVQKMKQSEDLIKEFIKVKKIKTVEQLEKRSKHLDG